MKGSLQHQIFDVLLIYLAFIILWFFLYAKVQFLAGTEVIQSTVAATVAATGSGNGTLDFVNGREGNCIKCVGYWNKKYSKFDRCDCK